MADLPLWPSLQAAWSATEGSPSGEIRLGTEVGNAHGLARWSLLQVEARTRVLRLESPGHASLVCKIYRTPAHLAWRTLGMVSRANREFTVMMEAHRRGLPVARPRYWLEHRVAGGLRFSAVTLDLVDGPDLEALLLRAHSTGKEQQRLARSTGDLLGRFHRQGLYWATANPRNLLLPADGQEPMRAIDFPYASLADASIVGTDEALLDLGCILRMSNGDLAFDGAARSALLAAYCEGDENAADRLDEQIVLRTHLAWKGRRLKRRVRNLLRPGARSDGSGGRYEAGTAAYRIERGGAITLPRPLSP